MNRPIARLTVTKRLRSSLEAILLGGAVASLCSGVAALAEELPPLPPPQEGSSALVVYEQPDTLGLRDPGMLESGDAEGVSTLPTLDTQPIPLASDSFDSQTGPSETIVSSDGGIPIDAPAFEESQPLLINYETALAMVGGRHPAVGFAQARVREAYANLESAKALWLPTIRAGVSYHRHDGNLQASGGAINDVNRNSLQAGLGAGAVGAGTTPRPGVVAEFQVSDAIFQPRIAERTAWAQRHAQDSVFQQQLLDVALAYNRLLLAHQELHVLGQSRERTNELAELTTDYAEAGEGLQADADRMTTELNLIESRVLRSQEQMSVAQHRLSEALSLDCVSQVAPADPLLTPIYLVDASQARGELISLGLAHRPELKELSCLVAATVQEYKRQKYAPFLPSVLMGVSHTGFGGGLGSRVNNVNSRTDLDLLAVWQVRNLGFGERAARSRAAAASQQAKYRQLQQMDRVAREISDGRSQIVHRGQQVTILQSAIDSATHSNQRNLSRIKDGQGLPLEVLQSVQALEQSQLSYARAVAEHNEAQFRLQWALGWPISGPLAQSP